MTTADSDPDLAATARIMDAFATAWLANHVDPWGETLRKIADHFTMIAKPGVGGPLSLSTQGERDVAAALLAAARREVVPAPRVWLKGDVVPAEVMAMTLTGFCVGPAVAPWRTAFDVIEAPLDMAVAVVAAEQGRRAEEESCE